MVMILLLGFSSGFGHCVGMCGGFVVSYSLKLSANTGLPANRIQLLTPHLLYNFGRMLTYVFLGGIFGLLGGTFAFAVTAFNLQSLLQIFAGLVMIYMGMDLLHLLPKFRLKIFRSMNPFRRLVQGMMEQLNRSNVFALGIILGFLPCGVVYAAGAKAASTGNVLSGMLTMMTFALGTFPAMILMGVGASWITGKFKRTVFQLSAVLVILLGGLTLYKGMVKFNRPVPEGHDNSLKMECCSPSGPDSSVKTDSTSAEGTILRDTQP